MKIKNLFLKPGLWYNRLNEPWRFLFFFFVIGLPFMILFTLGTSIHITVGLIWVVYWIIANEIVKKKLK